MKLNNLLITPERRVIISDFGCAAVLSADKTLRVGSLGSVGGNPLHLAPEIKAAGKNLLRKVDYSKQPSYELGLLAHEIFFGEFPLKAIGKGSLDDQYFCSFLPDDSHYIPKFFEWIKDLLLYDPTRRISLSDAFRRFHEFL